MSTPSHWHQLSPEQTLERIESQRQGLSAEAVTQRQAQYGPNTLIADPVQSIWQLIWGQISDIMVVILLISAGLSGLLGDYQDAIVILAIVIFFVSLGVYQEFRAEKAIAALKQLAVPEVRVRRAGRIQQIQAPELVPGDIMILETGDQIAADAHLIEVHALKAMESALTGESEPQEKQTAALESPDLPTADRRNLVYMGTHLTYGRGEAVVIATGMQTELGKIAALIQGVESRQTPLQRRLDQLGKTLAGLALACAALIFGVGLLTHEPLHLMVMSAIAVAVAAIPEGLPAVLTITLAFASQRMLQRHALVRKLTGIETLGSVSVICSDKTGTLTQNKMTVTHLLPIPDKLDLAAKPELSPQAALLLLSGLLCNDSELYEDGTFQGDPTEIALIQAAQNFGWDRRQLEHCFPRCEEAPFDSERKRMSTLHQISDLSLLPEALKTAFKQLPQKKYLVCAKGSIDGLLDVSTGFLTQTGLQPLDQEHQTHYLNANQTEAQSGRRVLGFALKMVDTEIAPVDYEQDLQLLGLMALRDPPRPEAAQAVKQCRQAGIQAIMITGDHPLTALKIAQDLKLTDNQSVITGQQLETMAEAELQQTLQTTSVFARVSPEHKLRIVHALQHQQKIVAMTGDGVNDAPALKQADIGVAMGITGTDVSKEAADMVLQDDNFATIIAAIEEGRVIYDNLRKFIKFSVAGNLGKILVMLLAPLCGMPLALLPIQMLWLNLLTDGLLGFGLGMEKAEKNIMSRPPTDPASSILGGAVLIQIIWMGALIGGLSLGLGAWFYWNQGPDSPWQTVIFTSLAIAQIFQTLGIRSSQDSLLEMGLFSNRTLIGMIGIVLLLQCAVLYIPLLAKFFHTHALSATTLLLIVGLNSLIYLIAEGLKASGHKV